MKKMLAVLVIMITILMVGGVALAATEEMSWKDEPTLQCNGVDCTSQDGETACYVVYYVDQDSKPACYVVYYVVPGGGPDANPSANLARSGK
jgi:hypothetical protein